MSRAEKSGDAYFIEAKQEQKYDAEEAQGTPGRIVTWVTAILGAEGGNPEGTTFDKIHLWLRDGVVLGRLINKLLETDGKPKVPVKAKATQMFAAMNNLENFNTGCRAYGVAETALFQTTDLYEGRKGPMLNVINCLNQLGFSANERGFQPAYEWIAPKADY